MRHSEAAIEGDSHIVLALGGAAVDQKSSADWAEKRGPSTMVPPAMIGLSIVLRKPAI